MDLVDKDLVRYLGSRHSAVGLLLFWLGLPALIGGTIFAWSAADEIPLWGSVSVALWGLLAVPLGLSMRRRRPIAPLWVLANLLLGVGLLAPFGMSILGK